MYGTSPILVRMAVTAGDLRSGIAGGLVSYIAGTAVIALLLLSPAQWRHVRATVPEAAKWFTYSGVSVSIAQLLIYMAFTAAPVSVVMSIQQLSIAFRFAFARMLTPKHEVFGGRSVLATALSLLGALVLSLDVSRISSALPPPFAALLGWHWP
jgi:uncharacterized membrane protein